MTDRRQQVVTALRAAANAIEAEGSHHHVQFYVAKDGYPDFGWPSAEQAAEHAHHAVTEDELETAEWGVWVTVEHTASFLLHAWPPASIPTEGIVDDPKE